MNAATKTQAGANPFTARTALALVLFGSCMFVALLWMIGSGLGEGRANNGGAHAEGRGLNGYAALSDYLERRGFTVRHGRSDKSHKEPGLLVLTPPANMDGKTIDKIVAARRAIGPTLVITPKWNAYPTGTGETNAKSGWVHLAGPSTVEWRGFLDNLTLYPVDTDKQAKRLDWFAHGIRGTFPQPTLALAGKGPGMVPLVLGANGRHVFAAYVDDGYYPNLTAMSPAGWPVMADEDEGEVYPLVIVYDPDLLDNYGMACQPSAQLAEALVRAALSDADGQATGSQAVTFDLTLNGIKRSDNLLTMAFSPPFLAATLCLLLAAGAVGWRAFLRFGPPRVRGRAIAFGKRALVTNSAGLIVRSRRYHLLGPPLAEASRQRLVRAFALPRDRDPASELAALDQAAQAASAGDHAFSQISARLTQARNQRDLVKAAHELHALERTLTK